MTLSCCENVSLSHQKDQNPTNAKISNDKCQMSHCRAVTLLHKKTKNPRNAKITYVTSDCHALTLSHQKKQKS
jgi:hypothetical protein